MDINSSSDIKNLQSHSVGCLVTLLMVSLDAQKFRSLIVRFIQYVSFASRAFGVIPRNHGLDGFEVANLGGRNLVRSLNFS